jgi:hypothetical protein
MRVMAAWTDSGPAGAARMLDQIWSADTMHSFVVVVDSRLSFSVPSRAAYAPHSTEITISAYFLDFPDLVLVLRFFWAVAGS